MSDERDSDGWRGEGQRQNPKLKTRRKHKNERVTPVYFRKRSANITTFGIEPAEEKTKHTGHTMLATVDPRYMGAPRCSLFGPRVFVDKHDFRGDEL